MRRWLGCLGLIWIVNGCVISPKLLIENEFDDFAKGSKNPIARTLIAPVMRSLIPHFADCYKKAWEKDHSIEGKIVFDIVVEEEGRVEDLVIERSTVGSKDLETCTSNVIRSTSFGKLKAGGFEFWYPLIFKLGDQ